MKNCLKKIKNNSFWYLTVCILGILIGVFSTLRGSDFLGIFLLVLASGLFSVFLYKIKDKKIAVILFIAFSLRIILALVQAFIFPLPDSEFDAVFFEKQGWEAARNWWQGQDFLKPSAAYRYSEIIGIIYYLFGRIELAVQMLNVFLGVLMVWLVAKIALEIFNSLKTSYVAGFLAAVFPAMNLYSALILRENLIIFFAVLSIYWFFLWCKTGLWKYILGVFLMLFVSSFFHWPMVFIGAVYALFLVFYQPGKINKRVLWSVKFVFLIAIFIFVAINFEPHLFSIKYIRDHLNFYARGRAAYLTDMIPNSYFDFVWQTPLRVIYFVFSPFPWMVKNSFDLVGVFDGFLYLLLLIFGVFGFTELWKKNKTIALATALIIAVFLIIFSWGTSNYGAALRHRNKIAWLFIVLAAGGAPLIIVLKQKLGLFWKFVLKTLRMYNKKEYVRELSTRETIRENG